MPQAGMYPSAVLGMDLYLHQGRLRFSANDADLPNTDQLIHKLEQLTTECEQRYVELEARLAEEQQLREEEQKKRQEAETELARLRALLEQQGKP